MDPLIDSLGRKHTYLRISVTDRCNLSCSYCAPRHYEHRPRNEILSYEEIVRAARIFARMGIHKIRLTGGEPLVRQDIEKLVSELASPAGVDTLAMTTNGTLLSERADSLRKNGLNAVNISLDTLKRERYRRITGEDRLQDVLRGADSAVEAGFRPLKLNVVVMAGVNDDELVDFVELSRNKPINVRFIEYMPVGGNGWSPSKFVPYSVMLQTIRKSYRIQPTAPASESAAADKEFRMDGFRGTIGFITPVSEPFCRRCNRVRLTSNGCVRSCLFSPVELDIRSLLRTEASDDVLEEAIRAAVGAKPVGHPPTRELLEAKNQEMIRIGG